MKACVGRLVKYAAVPGAAVDRELGVTAGLDRFCHRSAAGFADCPPFRADPQPTIAKAANQSGQEK